MALKFTLEAPFKTMSGVVSRKRYENSYVVADDIDLGFENKIPLWMFGLLY
ncbi:MAG: hypothetical protein J6M55_03635 [Paludibacteraceae bacterium]|nr:hypothetical protein [Paludibacteraceae bacterium]